MPAIRGILFDKDGTLIDFEATWGAVALAMAREAAEGDEGLANQYLALAGFDAQSGSFVADSVFAAGTNEDIVRLWHPALEGAELTERISYYDAYTSTAGAAAAVPVAGVPPAAWSVAIVWPLQSSSARMLTTFPRVYPQMLTHNLTPARAVA